MDLGSQHLPKPQVAAHSMPIFPQKSCIYFVVKCSFLFRTRARCVSGLFAFLARYVIVANVDELSAENWSRNERQM